MFVWLRANERTKSGGSGGGEGEKKEKERRRAKVITECSKRLDQKWSHNKRLSKKVSKTFRPQYKFTEIQEFTGFRFTTGNSQIYVLSSELTENLSHKLISEDLLRGITKFKLL